VALWPYTFTPIGTGMAAVITHSFLSFRIYRLKGQLWLFITFVIGALVSFALAVASGTKAWLIKDLDKLSVLTALVTWWLIFQMVLDTSIAGVMAYALWSSKTGYRKTDSVIHSLIRCAIQTGIFSTIFAAGDLICFATSPNTQFYGMFAIPLGRIYTNTLMHTLNLRDSLKEILSETIEMTSSTSHKNTKSIQIRVQDNVVTQFDKMEGFDDTRDEGDHRRRSYSDIKAPVHETQSTTSEVVFANPKHHDA